MITKTDFVKEILSCEGVYLPFLQNPVTPVKEYFPEDERAMVKLKGSQGGEYRLAYNGDKIAVARLGRNYWGEVWRNKESVDNLKLSR